MTKNAIRAALLAGATVLAECATTEFHAAFIAPSDPAAIKAITKF